MTVRRRMLFEAARIYVEASEGMNAAGCLSLEDAEAALLDAAEAATHEGRMPVTILRDPPAPAVKTPKAAAASGAADKPAKKKPGRKPGSGRRAAAAQTALPEAAAAPASIALDADDLDDEIEIDPIAVLNGPTPSPSTRDVSVGMGS